MTKLAINKLTVPSVPRATIDGWSVKGSGLPRRVINACGRQGVDTVGELRDLPIDRLMKIRSFGSRSLNDVADFFKFCDRLERGKVVFASAPDLLEHFLTPAAVAILSERYALHASDLSAAPGATLDAIGRRLKLTRERVRQQIVIIHQELSTRAAQSCLTPLVQHYANFIHSLDGVSDPEELANVPFRKWLGGLNPAHLLRLLAELHPSIILYNGLFSIIPAQRLEEIETAAVRYLRHHPKPQRLSDIIAEFEEHGWFQKQRGCTPRQVIRVMEHSIHIGATHDDHYFLFPEGAVYLLATLLSEFPGSARHRELLARFNEEVKPTSRRTPDYLTELLTRAAIFVRGRDGTYRLRK